MKADGLDEVLVTHGGQQSTVHHAEVKEQGFIQVGFPACGECAAGIVLPGNALEMEKQQAGGKRRRLRALGRGCQKGHLEHLCRGGTLVSVNMAPKNRRHLTTDFLRFVYLPQSIAS